jgi:hypothetical protein
VPRILPFFDSLKKYPKSGEGWPRGPHSSALGKHAGQVGTTVTSQGQALEEE